MATDNPQPGRSQSWTVGELLAWTADRFRQAGIDEARVDAEHLLALALGCKRFDLYVQHDRLLGEGERGPFRELVRRRLAREPVAYISGVRGFHALDLDLAVDRRVLIPRPETEHLVDWVLEWLPKEAGEAPARILDVGTGSGAIALAIKRARPWAQVTAVDRSLDALAVARANAERTGLDVTFGESDLLSAVTIPEGGFDAIVANLPYIPTGDLAELQPEVRGFEPRLALDGGADGLVLVRRLIDGCVERRALRPGGRIFLEIGIHQAPAVIDHLVRRAFVQATARRDYAGIDRVIGAEWPGAGAA
ncbi:MAG: peptide chain release factor N(5)-glutamine methyltransferase [Nannocystaceae bacterium]